MMAVDYKAIIDKFQRIINLSEEIHNKADWWYLDKHDPILSSDVKKWCCDMGVNFPEEYIACLTVSNGFTVDFASTTGYFHLMPFHDNQTLDRYFQTDDCKRKFEKKIPFKKCIGWLNHHCIYYDVFTGGIFIEYERYKYTEISDFPKEVLEPIIVYLEKEIERAVKGKKLLIENCCNPLKPMYDRLLKFAGNNQLPNMNIILEPPASEQEICQWEKLNNIKLPLEYRNWLKLSNGTSFENKTILSLDKLRKNYKSEFIDGVEYIYLVLLTGCFDYLMLNAQTRDYVILTEDFKLSAVSTFETEVFLDAFEFMENEMQFSDM